MMSFWVSPIVLCSQKEAFSPASASSRFVGTTTLIPQADETIESKSKKCGSQSGTVSMVPVTIAQVANMIAVSMQPITTFGFFNFSNLNSSAMIKHFLLSQSVITIFYNRTYHFVNQSENIYKK